MFTGIITAVGTISRITDKGADRSLHIDTAGLDLADVTAGDSICVSGVCLTVVKLHAHGFTTDVSHETLSCTTVSDFKPGTRVNLEKALRMGDRLGGHLVSGHVDGVGTVMSIEADARSTRYGIGVPPALQRYISRKGSVCVDGVSLTVNVVDDTGFSVNIIPHTLEETIFTDYETGTRVNLEVDLIARYLEGLLRGGGR
jgi:riboflavin synthase